MNQFKYILYARKSSEDKNRQVTSIEDQIKELTRIANNLNLTVVETVFESKSAKKPGREVFNSMLQKIHQGEADAILCWKLDRLARNPIDHGNIAWMLQQGIIQRINTNSSEYKPSDNVLMMQVEFGMATQYVRDLRTNVSRGTRLKAERGWCPASVLPVGYKHNPHYLANESTVEIIPDPKTYKKVKQLWNLLLQGSYNIADLKRHGDAIGLKSKKGNNLSHSTYDLLFRNPFYAGSFYWRNVDGVRTLFKGKHKKMVNSIQFEEVQSILKGNHRPTRLRERKYQFPFRGIMFCGECSGYVTAEKIHQVICTNCKYKYSVKTNPICKKCKCNFYNMVNPTEIIKKYYRCSKKKNPLCSQKSIEEKQILEYAEKFAEEMQIEDDFCDWAIKEIKYLCKNTEKQSQKFDLSKQEKSINKRLNGLITMKADGLISNGNFINMNEKLQKQLFKVRNEIFKERDVKDELRRKALHHLSLAKNAKKAFQNASLQEKKRILREIGYNLTLKDKKLSILTPKWILYLQDYIANIGVKKPWVQPEKVVVKYKDLGVFTPLIPSRLAETSLKRTSQIDQKIYFLT